MIEYKKDTWLDTSKNINMLIICYISKWKQNLIDFLEPIARVHNVGTIQIWVQSKKTIIFPEIKNFKKQNVFLAWTKNLKTQNSIFAKLAEAFFMNLEYD